jgi:hypothetical protein
MSRQISANQTASRQDWAALHSRTGDWDAYDRGPGIRPGRPHHTTPHQNTPRHATAHHGTAQHSTRAEPCRDQTSHSRSPDGHATHTARHLAQPTPLGAGWPGHDAADLAAAGQGRAGRAIGASDPHPPAVRSGEEDCRGSGQSRTVDHESGTMGRNASLPRASPPRRGASSS